MKQRIEIRNFGPIADVDIEIDRFMLFIGPQASGKSTIAKSIFFFKSLRDDLLRYILSELPRIGNSFNAPLGTFAKRVRQRYLDYWGPTFYLNNIFVKYTYDDEIWISLTLEENNKYVTPTFSPKFNRHFSELVSFVKEQNVTFSKNDITYLTTNEIIQKENEKNLFIRQIENRINHLFNEGNDLLFIPAGRSLLSTLSEQIQNLDTRKLDYLMRVFVERIINVKRIFNSSIDDLVLEKKKLTQDPINKESVRIAKELIERILKGRYINDKDGEKLYIDSHRYTKLNFSSSGQQESVWILHLIFLMILENRKSFVVIEEPEAHLFPIAQNDMAQLISLLNNQGNSTIITTHSPYILSCFNNFVYANELAKKKENEVNKILRKQFWLNPSQCSMYYIEKGGVVDLIEHDIRVIKTEMIDDASVQNNNLYSSLFDLE